MAIYTHNTRDTHEPCSFVKIIETDAPLNELDLSDDWFEVDVEEVSDIEELTDQPYAIAEGWIQLQRITTQSGHIVRKFGRL